MSRNISLKPPQRLVLTIRTRTLPQCLPESHFKRFFFLIRMYFKILFTIMKVPEKSITCTAVYGQRKITLYVNQVTVLNKKNYKKKKNLKKTLYLLRVFK